MNSTMINLKKQIENLTEEKKIDMIDKLLKREDRNYIHMNENEKTIKINEVLNEINSFVNTIRD
jgi:hypothetical protein